MAGPVFLGIDASLRSLGLCAVPANWNGDFEKVSRITLGIKLADDASPKERIGGMIDLSRDVRRFGQSVGMTHACYEDSLPKDAFQIKKASRLLGHIEHELAAIGIFAHAVNQSSARSYLLGALPKTDRKKITLLAVDDLTDIFQTGDEKDAFVTVNRLMSGFPGVFTYWKEKPPKAKRVRKVAGQLPLIVGQLPLPPLAQGWDDK